MHPHEQTALIAAQPFAVQVPDACRISGLSRSELYRRLAAGDIAAVKAGKRTLVLVDSLRDHITRLPAAAFRTPISE
jgi:hypothetical protein